MIKAYSAQNMLDANLVGGLFKAEGIECVVKGETLVAIQGDIPLTSDSAPSVWLIDESDFDRARVIVAQFESKEPVVEENWNCEKCGEENEGQFAQCWNCQQFRTVHS